MTSMSTQSPARERERDRARSGQHHKGQSCLCTAKPCQLWAGSSAKPSWRQHWGHCASVGLLPRSLMVGLEALSTEGMDVPMSSSVSVSSFMKYGSWWRETPMGTVTTHCGALGAGLPRVILLPLTLILLSFFWILLDTCSAQYCSLRKSQKMRPTRAFIQAMLAVSSWEGTAATSPCSEVAL